MADQKKDRSFVPRDYLPDSTQATITFANDSQIKGNGSVNLSRRQLGFTVPAAQDGSILTFTNVMTIFNDTSKTQRIETDYSGVNYDSMEGYMDLTGIKKVDDYYYVTMDFTLLSAGGSSSNESQESLDITTNVTLGDGQVLRGSAIGDDRSGRLELKIPQKQGNNTRKIDWMVYVFTSTTKTSRVQTTYYYADTETGDYRNFTNLREIRLDDDVYTVVLTKA